MGHKPIAVHAAPGDSPRAYCGKPADARWTTRRKNGRWMRRVTCKKCRLLAGLK